MDIIFSQKELNYKLNVLRSVVKPGPFGGIQITAENGLVTLFGTNGSCSIKAAIMGTILDEGSVLLPVMFSDIIAKQPSDEIQIVLEGSHVVIHGKNGKKKTRATLSLLEGSLPAEATSSPIVFRADARKFAESLASAQYAIAKDENRQVLTGLNLEIDPNGVRATALDGFRLSNTGIPGTVNLPDKPVKGIIPGFTVSVLTKVAKSLPDGEEISLAINQNTMQANCGEFAVRSSLVMGEYIDYKKILPNECKIQARVNKSHLTAALDRISVYSKGSSNKQPLVKLHFSNQSLILSANSSFGNAEEEVEAEICGANPEIKIAFNAEYLQEAIKAVSADEVFFKMNTSVQPIVLSDGETDKVDLLLPVRVYEAESVAS